jgi:hypothetical protein
MYKYIQTLILTVLLAQYAIAQDETETSGSHQGTYIGTEVLSGGSTAPANTYPLTFKISSDNIIEVTDADDLSAQGRLNGNEFVINRALPPQIFKGTVSDGVISGKTWGNPYVGRGTFSAELQ